MPSDCRFLVGTATAVVVVGTALCAAALVVAHHAGIGTVSVNTDPSVNIGMSRAAVVECDGDTLRVTLSPKLLGRPLASSLLLPFMRAHARKVGGARSLLDDQLGSVAVDGMVIQREDWGNEAGSIIKVDGCRVRLVLCDGAVRSLLNVASDAPSFRAAFINLASRPDRRAKMEAALSGAGVVAARFDARTGDTAEAECVLTHWSTRLNARFDAAMVPCDSVAMTASERGCAASHAALWHHVAALPTDGPPLLILEDDLMLAPSFAALTRHLIATVEARIPPSSRTTLVYLSGMVASWRDEWIATDWRDPKGDAVVLRDAEYLWQTSSYLIWPPAAAELVKALPADAPADNFLSRHAMERTVRALVCWPLPSMQEAAHEGDVVRSGF